MHIAIELLSLYLNGLQISLSLLLIQIFLNGRSSLELLHLLKQLFVPQEDHAFSQETIGENEETSILVFEGLITDDDIHDSFDGDFCEMFVVVIVVQVLDIVAD